MVAGDDNDNDDDEILFYSAYQSTHLFRKRRDVI